MLGISTIISIILIVLLTVSLSIMLLYFLYGTVGSMTDTGTNRIDRTREQISECALIESIRENKIYLKNCGSGAIENESLAVFLDDDQVEFSMTPDAVQKGEVGTITLDDLFVKKGDHVLKIITSGLQVVQTVGSSYSCSSDPNCVLWMDFDEGSGNIAYDSSSYRNNGALNNMGTENWVEGESGNALYFDGYDEYIRINNVPINTTSGEKNTVDFWMYWYGTENQMPFGWDTGYDLWTSGGCFGFNTGQGNVFGIPSSGLDNKWVHVTAVFYNGVPSASTVSLFIDGLKKDIYPCAGSTTNSVTVTPTLQISSWVWGGYYFNGKIDSFRIFRGDKSLAQDYANILVMK